MFPQILYFWVSAGYYIYHEGDNVGNGKTARLVSPALSAGSDQICVQFYYYMYGSDNRNTLRVLAKRGSSEEQVWDKSGIQSPSWLKGSVSVAKPLGTSLEVSHQGVDAPRFTSFLRLFYGYRWAFTIHLITPYLLHGSLSRQVARYNNITVSYSMPEEISVKFSHAPWFFCMINQGLLSQKGTKSNPNPKCVCCHFIFKIVFEAKRGFSSSCDTAVDNIVISEGACPGKKKKITSSHILQYHLLRRT